MAAHPDRFQELWQLSPGIADDDRLFLADIFDRFPRVHKKFMQFAATTPLRRVPLALQELEQQPRSGWLRFDIAEGFREILSTHGTFHPGTPLLIAADAPPVHETILEHCAEAVELAMTVFKGQPHLQWLAEILKFHDSAEAVITDFTPRDKITKPEKKRLELLGLDLLTESRDQGDLFAKHIYNCICIYEGECTDANLLRDDMVGEIGRQRSLNLIRPHQTGVVGFFENLYSRPGIDLGGLETQSHDIDALHMVVRGSRIVMEGHSRLAKPDLETGMKEFWDYVAAKLKTPEAKTFYDYLKYMYDHDRDTGFKAAFRIASLAYWDEMGLGTPRGPASDASHKNRHG